MTLDVLVALIGLPESFGIREEQAAHRLILPAPARVLVFQLHDMDTEHRLARSLRCAWLRLDKR